MNDYFEQPFEYLRRKETGEKFEKEVCDNWYKARAFVLDKLSDVAFHPASREHLCVVVHGDSPLMLSVVRQVALLAHYINYDEENEDETKRKRTVITIVSQNPRIVDELQKEEYLCNLPKYCKWSLDGIVHHKDSFIDIELELIGECTVVEREDLKVIKEEDVELFCRQKPEKEVFWIDTRKAQYANRMYSLGKEIDNLPYEDIHDVRRYAMALNVFQFIKMEKDPGKMINEEEWENEQKQINVLMALSNIFCSDCFRIRYNSIKPFCGKGKMTDSQALEKYYAELSKSEHARWVVEKLILGFRPMNAQERLLDERLICNKEAKMQFRNSIKTNWKSPVHIDLCSFADLRRIDPDNMKYDSFLMLGISEILKKVGEVPLA